MNIRSKKGFTLVEIMIVVVIIGLLAAMAIPAFQKVRASSIEKTVLNDARQLGSAAQQYMMEYGVTTFAGTTVATSDGKVSGPLTPWVSQISKGTTVAGDLTSVSTQAFILTKPGAFGSAATSFNAEGKKTSNN